MTTIRVLLALGLAINFPVTAMSKEKPYPEVTFEYSWGIDTYQCPNSDIKPEWQQEALTKISDLQAQWNKAGPELMQKTVDLIGVPFLAKERVVAIFLCPPPTAVEMSLPLQISVRWFINGPMGNQPFEDLHFLNTVYHELLHPYVNDILVKKQWNTPLLQKYAKEPVNLLVHLHLHALEEYVYLRAGKSSQFRKVLEKERKFLPPEYSNSRKIVAREGYMKFVEELIK